MIGSLHVCKILIRAAYEDLRHRRFVRSKSSHDVMNFNGKEGALVIGQLCREVKKFPPQIAFKIENQILERDEEMEEYESQALN